MSSDYKLISKKWRCFLENFTNEHFQIIFEDHETKIFKYELKNCYNPKIKINNDYGFLTIHFYNQISRDSLLKHISININSEKKGDFSFNSTTWDNIEFPCRVYFSTNNLMISFYDLTTVNEEFELVNNRIKVFKNMMLGFINLRIEDSIQKINN